MKMFAEILSTDLTSAIGWTLFHSLWQSVLLLLLVVACLRCIPSGRSSARYAVACAGLLLFVGASFATFLIESGGTSEHAAQSVTIDRPLITTTSFRDAPEAELLSSLNNWIQSAMPIIVGLWAIGCLYFSARLAGAYVYSLHLRKTSTPIDRGWQSFAEQAAKKLNIGRLVSVAESAVIKSPIVIGYVKPVILIPVGMLCGLTTEQVETIFWHELAHIKRHDYLINLLQSVVETIFFFNPCVRLLSNEIRKEREYCCDDLVVKHHGASRSYALALTRLAEAELAPTGFALALADNTNQLFARIKRIMERSASHRAPRGKILAPLVLVFAALLSISWLGTDTDGTDKKSQHALQRDTIPNEKSNSARYSRKSIITLDKNGKPHEEIVEEFEGDERLRPLLQQPLFPHVAIPGVPPHVIDPMAAPLMDTIPPAPFAFDNIQGWEELSRSLEEAFKGKFEEFYGFQPADSLFFNFGEDFLYPDAEAFKELEQQMEQFRSEHFRNFEDQFNFYYEPMGGYETKLRDELIKDGYLTEDEEINSLEWNDDSFKVNGKAIGPKHQQKYNELNNEFFGRRKNVEKAQ